MGLSAGCLVSKFAAALYQFYHPFLNTSYLPSVLGTELMCFKGLSNVCKALALKFRCFVSCPGELRSV